VIFGFPLLDEAAAGSGFFAGSAAFDAEALVPAFSQQSLIYTHKTLLARQSSKILASALEQTPVSFTVGCTYYFVTTHQ